MSDWKRTVQRRSARGRSRSRRRSRSPPRRRAARSSSTSGPTRRATSTTPTRRPRRARRHRARQAGPAGPEDRGAADAGAGARARGGGERAEGARRRSTEIGDRRDRALMSSYTTESEIDLAQGARRRRPIETQIQSAQAYLAQLTKRKQDIDARKARFGDKPIPPQLQRESESVDTEYAKNGDLVAQKRRELAAVVARYDADKARWRELKAIESREHRRGRGREPPAAAGRRRAEVAASARPQSRPSAAGVRRFPAAHGPVCDNRPVPRFFREGIAMAQYVYTMNRVGKIVPPKRQILKDISLSFFPGAKIGVLGLNGAGKSSLLKIMAGVDNEFEGEAVPMPGIKIGYLAAGAAARSEADRARGGRGRAWARCSARRSASTRSTPRTPRPTPTSTSSPPSRRSSRRSSPRRAPTRACSSRSRPTRCACRRGTRSLDALGRREAPRGAVPAAAVQARHAAAGRAHQPPRRRERRVARAVPRAVSRHRGRGDARPLLPRQRRRVDPRARPRLRHPVEGQLQRTGSSRRSSASPPSRSRRRRAPEGDEARARVGAQEREGPAGEEQGAHPALRGAVVATSTRSATRPRRSSSRWPSASATR